MNADTAEAIRRWMAGQPLSERDRAIVDAVLRINAVDQFQRMAEGVTQ